MVWNDSERIRKGGWSWEVNIRRKGIEKAGAARSGSGRAATGLLYKAEVSATPICYYPARTVLLARLQYLKAQF